MKRPGRVRTALQNAKWKILNKALTPEQMNERYRKRSLKSWQSMTIGRKYKENLRKEAKQIGLQRTFLVPIHVLEKQVEAIEKITTHAAAENWDRKNIQELLEHHGSVRGFKPNATILARIEMAKYKMQKYKKIKTSKSPIKPKPRFWLLGGKIELSWSDFGKDGKPTKRHNVTI